MQEEHPEDGSDNNTEAQQRNSERWEFALSVLKEAITDAGIRNIAEYKGEPLGKRWDVFFHESSTDIILKMFVDGLFGTIRADYSLLLSTSLLIEEVETTLNQPDANQLFDITDEDHPEVLRENARMILTALIQRIPIVAFRLLTQALDEAIQWHIKTHIEPRLKEHWRSLGKPEDFTISLSKNFSDAIQNTNEQFETLRKELSGDKRARLTEEKRANLGSEHAQLRSEYQNAKNYHDQAQKVYLAVKRNRTIDGWREEWETLCLRMFPDLHYRCLYEVADDQPFQLAHRHLAEIYGYSPQYMMKLVSQASGLKPKKTRRLKKVQKPNKTQ